MKKLLLLIVLFLTACTTQPARYDLTSQKASRDNLTCRIHAMNYNHQAESTESYAQYMFYRQLEENQKHLKCMEQKGHTAE